METIAAIATPPGRGGVGIVRISGPAVTEIAPLLCGTRPQARIATYCRFRDERGDTIDLGLALYFPAPHSYTGEHVLELHGHGGPVVLDRLMARVLRLGARAARPGEFSERAFLNDKLDLAQAEAVADLIDAASDQAARAALASLQGVFSRKVHELDDAVIDLRIYVEAAIDFPEEEIDFLADAGVDQRARDLMARLDTLIAEAGQGRLLRDGMKVVIAGRPNAGKSSLLNALAGQDAAIVTAIPGTTRDILREHIQIDGIPLHLIDTAGLRAQAGDAVEEEGIRRARCEIESADLILLVHDVSSGDLPDHELLAHLPAKPPSIIVFNKIDLVPEQQVAAAQAGPPAELHAEPLTETLYISAKTGAGLNALRARLKTAAGFQPGYEGGFMARRRHLDALRRARAALENGIQQLSDSRAGELLAEDLRIAHQALGEITGEFTSEDLLGRIFSSFCIGK